MQRAIDAVKHLYSSAAERSAMRRLQGIDGRIAARGRKTTPKTAESDVGTRLCAAVRI